MVLQKTMDARVKPAHDGRAIFQNAFPPEPPDSATCGLNGESPCLGASTTTTVPIFTRLKRSITSSLVMRMQPDEIAEPMNSGWLVPWMRYSVSLLPAYM